jgi:hypothetical protein
MSTHQGLPIAGYSPQPQERVDRVNGNKQVEERLLRMLDVLRTTDADPRWLAVAKTHFEEGFMAMNRAIFQPAHIKLDGEE